MSAHLLFSVEFASIICIIASIQYTGSIKLDLTHVPPYRLLYTWLSNAKSTLARVSNPMVSTLMFYISNKTHFVAVFWVPFQGTKRFIEEPPHHAIEAGLLGMKRNEDRMPIDDEDDDYYFNDLSITETKKVYMMNHDDIPRRSLERVEPVPFNVRMERYAGNTKLDSIKLPASSTAQPVRVAMKPILKDANTNTTTAVITTTTINNSSNKPWRSEFVSPTPDTGSVSSSTIIESGTATAANSSNNSTIEPTMMGRVMQPVANSIVPDGFPVTTTITTTTVISTMRP